MHRALVSPTAALFIAATVFIAATGLAEEPAPSPVEALMADAEAAVEDGLDAAELQRLGARALALVPTAATPRAEQDPRAAIRGAGIAIRLSQHGSGREAERLRSRAVDDLTAWLSAWMTARQLDAPDTPEGGALSEEAWSDLRKTLDTLRRVDENDEGGVATPREAVDDYDRLLRRIAERAPDDRVRAMVLVARLENRLLIDRLYGGLSPGERAEIAAEVRRGWERWPDVRVSDEKTLAEAVRWPLGELERLYLGAAAPEIEGVDLHARPMKLSDFRGRVVLLDFWASWCPPCVAAIPRQKELLDRHPDGFAIVGVSGDVEREDGLAAEERHGATWRSFWAYHPGEDGAMPPLKDTWYVRFWPTYYVLDRGGVIRYKGSWDEDLAKVEEVVVRLLAEPTGP